MKALPNFRSKAISLRKMGLTYSEILKIVPVAQSSISLWCKNISLTNLQIKHIQNIRDEAVKRGALIRHNNAIKLKEDILTKSSREILSISDRELWLIGIALYWAEGSKQSIKTVSQGVKFTNSDAKMIKLFDLWLTRIIKIDTQDIDYEIYLHESMSGEISRVIAYWSQILEKPTAKFDRIYLKNNILAKKYVKSDYKGVVRIVVKKTTNLNRQITGWQQGITLSCGIV